MEGNDVDASCNNFASADLKLASEGITPGQNGYARKAIISDYTICLTERGPVVLYKIDVEEVDASSKPRKKWSVFRRYSSFVSLINRLKRFLKHYNLYEDMKALEVVQMPKKMFLFGNFNQKRIQRRLEKLNKVLANILYISDAVFLFLSKEFGFSKNSLEFAITNEIVKMKTSNVPTKVEANVSQEENERLFQEVINSWKKCLICNKEKELEEMFVIETCKHSFCNDCARSTAEHARNHKNLDELICPVEGCTTKLPYNIIKDLIPDEEFNILLQESIKTYVQQSNISMICCPNEECNVLMEKVEIDEKDPNVIKELTSKHQDKDGKLLSRELILHRLQNRFRCRNCSTEFCAECKTSPYHLGYTCETYKTRGQKFHCRFCGNEVMRKGDICSNAECRKKKAESCGKVLPCGHDCCGIVGEKTCLPCIHSDCSETSQSSEDLCNLCWVEELGASPCILLECGHIFHLNCVFNSLRKKWPGPRITFAFIDCALCKKPIKHPALDFELKQINELKKDIEKRAVLRLQIEGMDKSPQIITEGSKFYKDPQGFAMDRFLYFMCFKCQRPYFAGQRVCDDGGREWKQEELVCGACSGAELIEECPKHGKEFIEFKCKFCCKIASFYCWGNTHFCDGCHREQCKGNYLTAKSPDEFPKCLGAKHCPLKVSHPYP